MAKPNLRTFFPVGSRWLRTNHRFEQKLPLTDPALVGSGITKPQVVAAKGKKMKVVVAKSKPSEAAFSFVGYDVPTLSYLEHPTDVRQLAGGVIEIHDGRGLLLTYEPDAS